MPAGGKIAITVENVEVREGMVGSLVEGPYVKVSVADTGSGMPPEVAARAFEPFFTTKGDLGSGIGLWVAKQLVERRGGQISVTSSTEKGHGGTTITIFIPFASPPSRLATERE